KISVALDVLARLFQGTVEMSLVDIANGEKPRLRIDVAQVTHPHAADADDGLRDLFARRCISRASENVSRNDRHRGKGCRLAQEIAARRLRRGNRYVGSGGGHEVGLQWKWSVGRTAYHGAAGARQGVPRRS